MSALLINWKQLKNHLAQIKSEIVNCQCNYQSYLSC